MLWEDFTVRLHVDLLSLESMSVSLAKRLSGFVVIAIDVWVHKDDKPY